MTTAGYANDPRAYWEWRGLTYADEEVWVREGADSDLERAIYTLSPVQTRPRVIVELGCAYGRLLRELRHRSRVGVQLVGVDFSSTQLARATVYLGEALHNAPAVALVRAAGDALPLASGCADVLYTHGVLMHIPPADLPAVIAEVARVASAALHVEDVAAADGFIWAHDLAKEYQRVGWRPRWAIQHPHPLPGQVLWATAWAR